MNWILTAFNFLFKRNNSQKTWKIIGYVIISIIIIALFSNAVKIRQNNKRIEKENTQLYSENMELKKEVEKYAKMPAINQQIYITLTNKAIFGKVESGNFLPVVEQIQEVTKKELLNYLEKTDSLNNIKNGKGL